MNRISLFVSKWGPQREQHNTGIPNLRHYSLRQSRFVETIYFTHCTPDLGWGRRIGKVSQMFDRFIGPVKADHRQVQTTSKPGWLLLHFKNRLTSYDTNFCMIFAEWFWDMKGDKVPFMQERSSSRHSDQTGSPSVQTWARSRTAEVKRKIHMCKYWFFAKLCLWVKGFWNMFKLFSLKHWKRRTIFSSSYDHLFRSLNREESNNHPLDGGLNEE